MGDIHGAFDLLDSALNRVSFDAANDRLFSVGDLINRGSRSADCLSYLQQSWFHAVRGNHEDMLMSLFNEDGIDWEMLYPFMGWMKNTDEEELHEINNAFKKLPIVIEIATEIGDVGIVHAEIPKGMGWNKFKIPIEAGIKSIVGQALYGRKRVLGEGKDGDIIKGIRRVFHGHTVHPKTSVLGNRIYIDTGAVKFTLPPDGIEKLPASGLTILEITTPVDMMCVAEFKDGICAMQP